VLRARVHDEVALVEERERVVRLHRIAVEHRVAVGALDNDVRRLERGIDVSPAELRDRAHVAHEAGLAAVHALVADAFAASLVEDRRVRLQGVERVGHRRQLLVVDLHQFRCLRRLAP